MSDMSETRRLLEELTESVLNQQRGAFGSCEVQHERMTALIDAFDYANMPRIDRTPIKFWKTY